MRNTTVLYSARVEFWDRTARAHPSGQPAHDRDRRDFDLVNPTRVCSSSVSNATSPRDSSSVQERLNREALEEYIEPIGGGFYFALPGVTRSDGWLGEGPPS